MEEDKKGKFLQGLLSGIALMICLNLLITTFLPSVLPNQALGKEPKRKLQELQDYIDTFYVNEYEESELYESMYLGYVYGLQDRYSAYMDKETFSSYMQDAEGIYAGVGAVASEDADGYVVIVTVYENAPASNAGIISGDKILEVNGLDVQFAGLKEVTSMLKGPEGTKVNVKIFREETNETIDIDITREAILMPTITHKMIEGNIGYLRILEFDGVTYDQFVEAIGDLDSQGMEKLILDVRNNPGGNLETVSKITDLLVPEGTIVYTEDKNGKKEYVTSDKEFLDIPIVLLVNGNSASASEVLAGAVRDYEVGILIGEKTFGKGVVQKLFQLSDGSAIKLTTSRYFSPKGECIHGIGIEPDIFVELDEELALNITNLEYGDDIQLQKAVEVLQ